MTTRIQISRSQVAGFTPANKSQEPGTLYVNFADSQLGVFDEAKLPQALIGIPFYKTTAQYAQGDLVRNGPMIYRANSAITPGPWDVTKWTGVLSAGKALIKEFSTIESYLAGEVVFKDNHLFKALAQLNAGAWNPAQWVQIGALQDDVIDAQNVGYKLAVKTAGVQTVKLKVTPNGDLLPSSNAQNLGSSTLNWGDVFAKSLTLSGNLTGTGATFTGEITASNFKSSNNTSVGGGVNGLKLTGGNAGVAWISGTGDLLPNTTGTQSLGSATKKWQFGEFSSGITAGVEVISPVLKSTGSSLGLKVEGVSGKINMDLPANGSVDLRVSSATVLSMDSVGVSPTFTDSLSLGTTSRRWKTIYGMQLNALNGLQVGDATVVNPAMVLADNAGGTARIELKNQALQITAPGAQTKINNSWLPSTDNTVNLGASTFQWHNLYLGNDLNGPSYTLASKGLVPTVDRKIQLGEPNLRMDSVHTASVQNHKDSLYLESKVSAGGQVVLDTDAGASIIVKGNRTLTIDSQGLMPAVANTLDLGSTSFTYRQGFFSGTVQAANVASTSDRSKKDSIRNRLLKLDDICAVAPRAWFWKETNEISSGVIADELEGLLPELVHGDPGNQTVSESKAALVIALNLARELKQERDARAALEEKVSQLVQLIQAGK